MNRIFVTPPNCFRNRVSTVIAGSGHIMRVARVNPGIAKLNAVPNRRGGDVRHRSPWAAHDGDIRHLAGTACTGREQRDGFFGAIPVEITGQADRPVAHSAMATTPATVVTLQPLVLRLECTVLRVRSSWPS
jgi:hypothetical protein